MEALRDNPALKAAAIRLREKSENWMLEKVYDCEDGCRDTGWLSVFGEQGQSLGVKPCSCLKRKTQQQRLKRLLNSDLFRQIPPIYRMHTLETITPDPARYAGQGEKLAYIQAHPDDSYCLFGDNGTGKTMIGWMLFRHAIEQGRPAVGVTVRELVEDRRESLFAEGRKPKLNREDLKTDAVRWLVFLDEFHRCKPSEFAAETLWDILDVAYSYNHQIIITANERNDYLIDHWSKEIGNYGRAIMRRVLEADGMTKVEMF